jgi:hypothetical protein
MTEDWMWLLAVSTHPHSKSIQSGVCQLHARTLSCEEEREPVEGKGKAKARIPLTTFLPSQLIHPDPWASLSAESSAWGCS